MMFSCLKRTKMLLATGTVAFILTSSAQAQQPYVGELALVPYNFAPSGWAFCEGQLLPIAQNDVLFTLIGTTFGGDGQTTFALPDLRGRVPVGVGQRSGSSSYLLGQTGGVEEVTLTVSQLPIHTHSLLADSTVGSSESPAGAFFARDGANVPEFGTTAISTTSSNTVQLTGGSLPHNNLQPYTTFHWIISLFGIFPSQSRPVDINVNK